MRYSIEVANYSFVYKHGIDNVVAYVADAIRAGAVKTEADIVCVADSIGRKFDAADIRALIHQAAAWIENRKPAHATLNRSVSGNYVAHLYDARGMYVDSEEFEFHALACLWIEKQGVQFDAQKSAEFFNLVSIV